MSGEGDGTPLQYSCLENPMDGGAWRAAVHGVTKSWTRLSDFTFAFHFHALEKEMATHSSILAWRIPGTGEPGAVCGVAQSRTQLTWLSSSRSSVCMSMPLSQFIPSSLPLLGPQVHSLPLCLRSYPANRFISTVFLASIYIFPSKAHVKTWHNYLDNGL